MLPAAVAYVGQLIVHGVVAAIEQSAGAGERDYRGMLLFVGLEALIVAAIAGAQRCSVFLDFSIGHDVWS